jgi:DNA-binding beta-propeller fold protein YncE
VITDDCNATDDDCDGSVDEDVKAGWILVTVDGGDEAIYQIDTTTAAMTTLAALDDPGLGNVNTMDVSEDGVAIIHSVDTGQLVEIDVCTGTTAAIGSTNVGNTNGIAFDADHTLYGIDTDNDELVWYDTLTGNGTVIGSLGFGLGNGGLAYDCATDTLYGVDGSSNDIFVLDRATGLASGFIGTSVPFSAVGIEFDHTSRTLFASTGSALYQIDPASGASTYIGAVSTAEAVNDLAFHPSCP